MRSFYAAFLLMVIGAPTLAELPPASKLRSYNYFVDSVTFWNSADNTSMVELFSLIPTGGLIFIKSPNGFVARYRLKVEVFDQADALVARQGLLDSTLVKTFKEIDLPRSPRIARFSFILEPGEYRSHLTLTDLETRESLEFGKKVSVHRFARNTLQISDIQVATSISVTTDSNAFVKNERLIIPNVPRFVTDKLRIYMEVYNFAQKDYGEFETRYTVQSETGAVVKSFAVVRPKPGGTVALSLAVPVAGLEAGRYALTLQVRDLDNGQKAERAATFYILLPGQAVDGIMSRRLASRAVR